MTRRLPARPSLEHLRKQARQLLRGVQQGNPEACERLRSLLPPPLPDEPRLADAQRAIAREYGFPGWGRLKARVEELDRAADPAARLVDAVKAGSATRVRAVLQQSPALAARLNEPLPGFGFGGTALLHAVSHGKLELVDVLLDAGADINQRSHWWAGGFGVLDDDGGLAPQLIARGARVDIHAAVRLEMRERVEALLRQSPELVHARGGDGQTPLHVAPTVEMAALLLEAGADIDARDVDHESTPAQYMVRDRQGVARHLVARGCRTDILMAAALGDLALVREYLDRDPSSLRTEVSERYFPRQNIHSGATIYLWTLGNHKTAHLVAREFGHEDILQLLLERSPEDLRLAVASELGDEPLGRRFLKARPGSGMEIPDSDRRRVAIAAQNNNGDAVRLLLEGGWPATSRGQHGGTPLHWAAWHGNAAMVRELLAHGAAVHVRGDEYDLPPLGWALHGSLNSWHRDSGDYALTVRLLREAGAELPRPASELEGSDEALGALG